MKRILTALCASIALASCSSHGSGIVPAAGNTHVDNAPSSLPPPPVISETFIRNAGHIDAPNVPLRTLPRFLKSGHGIAPMSTALPGDLEQVGVAISPGGPYAGVYAAQTAYTSALLQIGYPAGASGTSSLFAPLIVPSNKACLGTGEIYSNAGTGTSASFFVVDVCAGAIPFATPIDATFAANYTRTSLRGAPELLSLVFSTSAVPTASSVWYAMLYNYAASRWDIITQKTGISGNGTGVSTWLSEFVPGQCPNTPPIASDSMYLYNATSGNFEVMTPTMAHTTTSIFTTNPTCYLPDTSGPASFAFAVSVANSSWGAVSTLDSLDSAVMQFMTTNQIRAGQLAVVKNGTLLLSRAYTNSADPNYPKTKTTSIMRIASESKAFSYLAGLRVVSDSLVSSSTAVFPYLGITQPLLNTQTPDPNINAITVNELLNFTSGLSGEQSNTNTDPAGPGPVRGAEQGAGNTGPLTIGQFNKFLYGYPLQYVPGTTYNGLTNADYYMIDRVVEKASGQAYWAYIQSKYLTPLSISDAVLTKTPQNGQALNEVTYDSSLTGLSVLLPNSNVMVPCPYGGNFVFEVLDSAAVAISAQSYAKFIDTYYSPNYVSSSYWTGYMCGSSGYTSFQAGKPTISFTFNGTVNVFVPSDPFVTKITGIVNTMFP